MAELNFGLINQNLPGEIAGSVQRGREDAVRQQMAQQQLLSSQQQTEKIGMEMERFKRSQAGLDEFIAYSAKHGMTGEPEALALSFQKYANNTGNPELMIKAQQAVSAAQERKRYNLEQGFAPAAAPAAAFGGETAPDGNMLAAKVAPTPTPDGNMLAAKVAPTNSPIGQAQTPGDIQRRIIYLKNSFPNVPAANTEISFLTKELEELQKGHVVGLGGSLVRGGNAVFTAPERQDTDLIRNYNAAVKQGFKGDIFEYERKLKEATRTPAQPRAESPLVAIEGPDGNPILVSRENAVNKKPANMIEKPMTEGQRLKYNKGKVSDKDIVTGAFAVTGELEKLTDELVGNPDKKIAPAPGLNSITGFNALTNAIALPSGDAKKALQKLETFKGKIMALGRQLASQEGKLGNMAVQEWKFVSDAVQKIDPAAGNLDEQMRDVVRQAREYANRQQSKYEDTYADEPATQKGNAAPPAPAAITNPQFPGFSVKKP